MAFMPGKLQLLQADTYSEKEAIGKTLSLLTIGQVLSLVSAFPSITLESPFLGVMGGGGEISIAGRPVRKRHVVRS